MYRPQANKGRELPHIIIICFKTSFSSNLQCQRYTFNYFCPLPQPLQCPLLPNHIQHAPYLLWPAWWALPPKQHSSVPPHSPFKPASWKPPQSMFSHHYYFFFKGFRLCCYITLITMRTKNWRDNKKIKKMTCLRKRILMKKMKMMKI